MIQKVVLRNICSWKGRHEVNYDEGMVLFDGPYGAGKSSLLTDSLDLVFSGTARAKLSDIITRGETEGEVEVYLRIRDIDYKIYFFHRLKENSENIKGGKKVLPSVTTWKTYQLVDGEYVELDATPQKILGISYETVAKKTFLIWQFDLDVFSKAGPTEKYDIIAEAFQISKLFDIGELAGKEADSLQQRKDQLLEQFQNIDTAQFSKKDQLKEELENFGKQKIEKEGELKWLREKKEQEIILSTKNSQLEKYREELTHSENILKDLSQYKLEERKQRVEELKKSLENQDPELKKKEEQYNANTAQISFLQEKKTNDENNVKNEYHYKIKSVSDTILSVIEKLKTISSYGNKEIETTLEQNLSFYESINKWELSQQREILQKEIQGKDVEIRTLESQILQNKSTQEKIKKLEGCACPTCQRVMNTEEGNEVVKSLEWVVVELEKKKKESEIKKVELQTQIQTLDSSIVWRGYFEEYQEIKILKDTGVKKQEELKQLKTEQEKRIVEIAKQNETIEKIQKENEKLLTEIQKLRESSNVPKIQKEIQELEQSWIIVLGAGYHLIRALELETEQKSYKKKTLEQIEKIQKELEKFHPQTLIDLNTKIEKLEGVVSEMVLIYNDKYFYYNTILQSEEQYKKIEKQVEEINQKLSIYEKIKAIFGKKGEPRTILQNHIIPNLENSVNDILDEITDGLYRVRFKLEAITAQGKESKKNTFDIIVYQQWVDQVYETLSGWERTNINYAIRLGITQTLNDILGEKISDFLILDETFRWDLDAENGGDALANSVTRTLESGRFKQIFIITHTEYIKEKLEDRSQVIRIQKKGKYSKIETED